MKALLLQPPSPAHMNVKRDYAGGMGVADPSERATYGHDPNYITLPYMSLLYSAAVLERRGLDVAFLDAEVENCDLGRVLERVAAVAPQVLAMVVNLPSVYGDIGLAQAIKTRFPEIKIVAIGAVATPLFDLLADSGAFDAVIRGDPEVALPGLLDALGAEKSRGNGAFEVRRGVLTNKAPARITDLDALPGLPYHLLAMEKYWYHGFGKGTKFAAVFASRGCAFRCYYCPYPVGFGGAIVHRDPVRVVDEIEGLCRRFGIRDFLFRDQVFTMETAKTTMLCDEILRRGLDIRWVIETRLDRVNEALLKKLKAAGCMRIHYGLESGDPALFRRVGKDGAIKDMDTLLDNFRMTEEIGIHPHMFVLVGLLGETWETIANTVGTIRKIKPLTLQVSIVTPYPGTPLFDEAKQKKLIVTEDWSKYTGFIPVMRTESLSTDDLLRARELIIREHQSAIFWKRQREKAKLLAHYTVNGSLPRRLARRVRVRLGGVAAALPAMKGPLCSAAYHCGLAGVYRSAVNRRLGNPVRILSLHQVIDDAKPMSEADRLSLERGCLSLREFKRRIGYLKTHYRFVPLEEYLRCLHEGEPPKKNVVVLTFDDGFKDVYACAYPFLKAEQVPFTLFVTTGLVGRNGTMLTREEIATMAGDPLVSWGAHSVSHRPLTELSPAEAEREITASKAALETMLGRRVTVFSYPDGKTSDAIKQLVARNGFEAACATGRRMNNSNADLFALQRIPFVQEPFERFAFRMAGRV